MKREKKTAVSYPADEVTLRHLHPLDTSLSVSINTIHAVRAQRKVEAASKNAAKVVKKVPWYRLIARKSSFKEVLELKLEKDPFDYNMTIFRRFQKLLCAVMGHAAVELLINAFILGNTVVLALYHHDMNPDFERSLDIANLVRNVQLNPAMSNSVISNTPLSRTVSRSPYLKSTPAISNFITFRRNIGQNQSGSAVKAPRVKMY